MRVLGKGSNDAVSVPGNSKTTSSSDFMIPAVAQTLANILAIGTSLTGLEQISLAAPDTLSELKTGLNLYFYDVRQTRAEPLSVPGQAWTSYQDALASEPSASAIPSSSMGSTGLRSERSVLSWFDVSFVITAHNQTALGMQALLSEALTALMRHQSIPKELLAPKLKGYEPLCLSLEQPPDIATFWSALNLPLRPAIFVMVTVPFRLERLTHAQPMEVSG